MCNLVALLQQHVYFITFLGHEVCVNFGSACFSCYHYSISVVAVRLAVEENHARSSSYLSATPPGEVFYTAVLRTTRNKEIEKRITCERAHAYYQLYEASNFSTPSSFLGLQHVPSEV